MSDQLGPLDPEVEALLSAERDASGAPDEARARVRTRVLTSIGVVGAATGVGSASGSHTAMQGARLLPKLFSSLPAKLVVAALGVTAAGVGVHVALHPSVTTAPQPPKISAPAEAPSFGSVTPPEKNPGTAAAPEKTSTAPAPPVAAPNGDETSAGARATKNSPVRNPTAARSDDDEDHLSAERALLEPGREALARGDFARALAAAERHAHRFPRGQLVEERESLRVRALAAGGRADEAARRAAEFRERFPRSIFLPIVNAAVPPTP